MRSEKSGYVPIPVELLDGLPYVSTEFLRALLYLFRREYEEERPGVSASDVEIAAGSGLSVERVRSAMRVAIKRRWVVAEGDGRYHLRTAADVSPD